MKVTGIICEYNPFHNGHLKHIIETKNITNCDFLVCVMSGNFTQRSTPSILDKFSKAKLALENGVDLVIELPTIFATSCAENFAYGAINILNNIKIIDSISFGTSCKNHKYLEELADILYKEPREFKELLNMNLLNGFSYPQAFEQALYSFTHDENLNNIINEPNNILAIEYIKQIKKSNANFKVYTIFREVNHLDDIFSKNIASGKAIRSLILNNDDFSPYIPKDTFLEINKKLKYVKDKGLQIYDSLKPFEKILFYKLRTMSNFELEEISDVSEGLEYRILESAMKAKSLEELISFIKTKRYTESRIRRILLNVLLNIRKKDVNIAKKNLNSIRVLGFNENGRKLLKLIHNLNPSLDIIVSVPTYLKNSSSNSNSKKINILKDIEATNLYNLIYDIQLGNEDIIQKPTIIE